MAFSGIDARLAKERRARLQAERLLALRSEELYSANRKLSEHAHALSSQVIEQREENAALKGQTTQVAAELEVAASRAALAEQRLWDSLTAVEDGFAIFDRDCRLVVANPAFLAPFEGISDIAPGASYDAILRVVVDEGIVDIEGAEPDQWLETMLKRWERVQHSAGRCPPVERQLRAPDRQAHAAGGHGVPGRRHHVTIRRERSCSARATPRLPPVRRNRPSSPT
jgi:PAS domain-containing protein